MIAFIKHYMIIVINVIKYSLISSIVFSIFIYSFTVNIPDVNASHTQRYSPKAPTNYINPKWWQGTQCDTYHHPGSKPLPSPSTWNNLTACGPMPEKGAPDVSVSFGIGSPQLEWECTELVMRYMFLAYHVTPYAAYGAQIVSSYNHTGSPTLTPIINNGQSGQVPQVGDILSYGIWGSKSGHTSIVIGYNSNTHYYTVFQQNAQYAITSQDVYLQGNIVKDNWEGAINGWLHANSAPPVDNAQYISQSPYPTVQTNQSFSIFFQLQNTGNTTWSDGGGYALVCSSNCMGINQVGFAGSSVQPQQQWTFNINLTAPSSPGTYTTQWGLSHNGTSFGPGLSIIVTVQASTPGSIAITTPITINTTPVNMGSTFSASFTIANSGGSDYTNIQQLDLWVQAPTNNSNYNYQFEVGTYNITSLGAGSSQQITIPSPSFASNCSTYNNCSEGGYQITARFKDSGGSWYAIPPAGAGSNTTTIQVERWQVVNVGANYDGHLEAFDRDSTGSNVQHNYQSAPNSQTFSGWGLLNNPNGQYFYGNQAVILNSDGNLATFARGQDGQIYQSWQTCHDGPGCTWTQWYSMQDGTTMSFAGDPTVAMNQNGDLDVFVRGTDGAVWHNYQLGHDTTWSGWISLGAYITGNISTITDSNGDIEAFIRGGEGALHYAIETSPNSGSYGGWNTLGSSSSVWGTDPTVAMNPNGTFVVLVEDTGKSLYEFYQTSVGGTYTQLYFTGNTPQFSTIFLTMNPNNELEVFIVGGTDHGIYHQWETSPNASTSWSGWGGIASSGIYNFNGDVSVIKNQNGAWQLFAHVGSEVYTLTNGTVGQPFGMWQLLS